MLFFSKISRSFPEPTKSSHVPSSFAVAFLARIWQVWLEISIWNLPSCDLKYFMLFVLAIVYVFNMICLFKNTAEYEKERKKSYSWKYLYMFARVLTLEYCGTCPNLAFWPSSWFGGCKAQNVTFISPSSYEKVKLLPGVTSITWSTFTEMKIDNESWAPKDYYQDYVLGIVNYWLWR